MDRMMCPLRRVNCPREKEKGREERRKGRLACERRQGKEGEGAAWFRKGG